MNSYQAWVNSEAQNPTGPPSVVETAGFATTISTARGFVEVVSTLSLIV